MLKNVVVTLSAWILPIKQMPMIFFLTTLLIIDDYGEGIPVGWMVSNKEEKLMIICFLQAIRKNQE